MHELSIALSIVDVAQEEAQRRGVIVDAVHLRLGPLAGVVKDALLSSYALACEQTCLAGSKLLIEEVPILVNCSQCHGARPIQSIQWFVCSECGSPATDIVQGRELLVTALEVRS